MYIEEQKGFIYMLKKFAKQLSDNTDKNSLNITSPIGQTKNRFLKKLSKYALDLYVKNNDIKKFTKLALSNPEDASHDLIAHDMFDSLDVFNPFESSSLEDLAANKKFLNDLNIFE